MKHRLLPLLLACALLLCGAAQAEPFDIEQDTDAFRGVPWDYTMEETAWAESLHTSKQHTRTVTVTGSDMALYDMLVKKISYRFEDGVMAEREFLMQRNRKDTFTSLFYSLFLRYGPPFEAKARTAYWQAGPLGISLSRGDELKVVYTLWREP